MAQRDWNGVSYVSSSVHWRALTLVALLVRQPQYTEAFATEGVEVHQLRNLDNSTIRRLVQVEGHRRRLVRFMPALRWSVLRIRMKHRPRRISRSLSSRALAAAGAE